MKNLAKFVGITTFVAVIVFSMVVCNPEGNEGGETDNRDELYGQLNINGVPYVGSTLTATYSNGNGSGTETWQWIQGDSTTIGTNSNIYTVTSTDIGKTIKVQVSFSDQKGSKTSNPTVIVFAYDGPIWTAVSNSTFGTEDNTINGIAWGGPVGQEKFVAVGRSAKMAYSYDGINWTAITDNPFNYGVSYYNFAGVAWCGDKFVASTDKGSLCYSSDGINWTLISGPLGSGDAINGNITSFVGNKIFINSGRGSPIAYSTNGINPFTQIRSLFGITYPPNTSNRDAYNGITWSGSAGDEKYVVVGHAGNPSYECKIAYSTDLSNWTAVTIADFGLYVVNNIAGINDIYAVAYGGLSGQEKFVIVGTEGKIAYSSNCDNWATVTNSTFDSTYISSIIWSAGKFIAVGSGGKMAYSSDGINWTSVADSTFKSNNWSNSDSIRSIAYGNKKFVAVGANGQMAYSNEQE